MRTNFLLFIVMAATNCVFSFGILKASEIKDTIPGTNDTILKSGKEEKPTVIAPYHLNVIKFNPTPMVMFEEPRNVTFSYERLIKNNNSLAFQIGYLVFPQILKDTLLNVLQMGDYSTKGINIAFEYRHYPCARNRHPAPDGLYYGGYLSYYGNSFTNTFTVINRVEDQTGSFKGKANMTNLGVEIGYQFILGKRFSIDMLMFGPSITLYNRNLELTGALDGDIFDQIDQELASKLLQRFPALGFLYRDQNSTFSGSNIVLSTSFRYSIQIGYHF